MNTPLSSEAAFKLLTERRFPEARAMLAQMLSNNIEPAQAMYGMGVLSLQQGDFQQGAQFFQSAIAFDPNHSNALYQLGFIAERAQDMPKALHYWRESLRTNPNNAAAIKKLQASNGAASSIPYPPQPPPRSSTPQYQPQPMVAPPAPSPSIHPESAVGREAISGHDLYGLFKRSAEPVEKEITRLLDGVAIMMQAKRQRVRAFIGKFIFLWVLCIAGLVVAGTVRANAAGAVIALLSIGLGVLFTIIGVLKIKCTSIDSQRYGFVLKTGVLSTRSVNDHLYLMSRSKVVIRRSLLNRLTNDGSLILYQNPKYPMRFRGFFTGAELSLIQSRFLQLSMLMPTSRDILTAIGELKNIRSGT